MMLAEHIVAGDGHGTPVLQGVTFEIAAGEVVGLCGVSGSGKSTLARVLGGHLTPQSGRVTLNGAPLPRKGLRPVQMIWQTPEHAVDPRWRIRDILAEGFAPDASIIAALGLRQEWMTRFPHELSGGELQRICIARALGPGVRAIIADEISGMLDPITQADVWHVLRSHAAQTNIAILAISHDESLLAKIATRQLRLSNGMLDVVT